MPYSAQDIVNRVRDTLIDPTPWTYWSDVALLGHINNAIGAIVQLDKKASVVNAPFQLAAGTKQLLPPDAVALIDIPRNMGTNGATPGRAITMISMEDLIAWRPRWNSDPTSPVIRHVMATPEDPRRWYNWPPSDGTNYAEIQYEQVPDDIALTLNNLVSTVASGQSVLPMSNTNGITVGQLVQDLTSYYVRPPNQPSYPVIPGTKVQSIIAGTSITLTAPLQGPITASDWLSFSDPFPLPDLYAEPTYNFVLAHALDRNSSKGDPGMSNTYWQRFMALLAADDQTIDRLGIGRPAS